ncbi:hypothetical protein GXW82_34265 [Streptacidiphilus sp. 4-A2]|nr:hypothetical protein [Streptacidiphilus sp. 4-A2]
MDGEERSRISFGCEFSGKGRIEELDPQALALAARRLLDRFCATLVVELDSEAPQEQQLFEVLEGLPDLGDFPDLADLSELSELPDIDSPDLFMIEESVAPGPRRWTAPGPGARRVRGAGAPPQHGRPLRRGGRPRPPRGRYGPALPPRSARSRAAARWGSSDRRMGEPPNPEGEYSRMPWLVGGSVAVVGGMVLLARALRRR